MNVYYTVHNTANWHCNYRLTGYLTCNEGGSGPAEHGEETWRDSDERVAVESEDRGHKTGGKEDGCALWEEEGIGLGQQEYGGGQDYLEK